MTRDVIVNLTVYCPGDVCSGRSYIVVWTRLLVLSIKCTEHVGHSVSFQNAVLVASQIERGLEYLRESTTCIDYVEVITYVASNQYLHHIKIVICWLYLLNPISSSHLAIFDPWSATCGLLQEAWVIKSSPLVPFQACKFVLIGSWILSWCSTSNHYIIYFFMSIANYNKSAELAVWLEI